MSNYKDNYEPPYVIIMVHNKVPAAVRNTWCLSAFGKHL